uniref:Uncharacterized protein n=1 Tax=Oryza meridionalis TaxID=40149 RepID=A0A0E0D9J3_9ORYZ
MSMTRLYMSSFAYAALEKWSGKWRLSVWRISAQQKLPVTGFPRTVIIDKPHGRQVHMRVRMIVRRVLGKADSGYAIAQTHITQCNGNATARQPKREEETEEK